MGDKTGIGWTDATWNPVRGCSRVSAGCENCYAETMAGRFKGKGMPYEGLINKHGAWNGNIKLVPEKLDEPLRWTKPRRVFVNSMSDLFHENVPFDFIADVFAVMSVTTRHTYQILTKRPERMREFFRWVEKLNDESYDLGPEHPSGCESMPAPAVEPLRVWPQWTPATKTMGGYDNCGPRWPPENVHLGVSVEDQATADERIPLLLETPAAVRFVSYEPALGPVDFTNVDTGSGWRDALNGRFRYPSNFKGGTTTESVPVSLDWIIVGGESGPGARPMQPDWARDTRDACADAGVAFFFKQYGAWIPGEMVAKTKGVVDTASWFDGKWSFSSVNLESEGHRDDEPELYRIGKHNDDPSMWNDEMRVQEFPVGLAEAGEK